MTKTKVVAREPSSSISNLHLGKHQLNQKLENRLSVLHKQRKLSINGENSLAWKIWQDGIVCSSKSTTKNRFAENAAGTELEAVIDIVMKLQQDASDTGIATNRTYELQLLLIFLHTFISTIFNAYYTLDFFAGHEVSGTSQNEWFANILLHLIRPIIFVVVTVLSFASLISEFQKSQVIVNKIIIHASEKDIRTRFSAFSQQIQSNIPKFHVFGFFNLDGSCLFSMVSSITTYLIILVQSIGNNVDGSINANQVNETAFPN